jgi:hypothetical protein
MPDELVIHAVEEIFDDSRIAGNPRGAELKRPVPRIVVQQWFLVCFAP